MRIDKQRFTRRSLLAGGAVFGSSVALEPGAAISKSYSGEMPWSEGVADAPRPASPGAYVFFTPAEVAFVDAAVARLIPADDLGPGANEAGVTIFLDRQLAGDYGRAQRWYMLGPWQQGAETQGYQSRLTPAQLYRISIAFIDDHCRKAFDNKAFSALSLQRQDEMLMRLEKGQLRVPGIGPRPIEGEGVTSDTFFAQLLQNTIEGFFSDPLYGGNREMVAWKLIGFPGARYDYRDYVSEHGKKLNLAPIAIKA
jgi:gluconate 2-dehydrogenase gamma chain